MKEISIKQNKSLLIGLLTLAMLLQACNMAGAGQISAATTTTIPVAATATATVEPTKTSPPPTLTATAIPTCDPEPPPDFADYATWTRVNHKPIKGHEVWVNVYVNDLAKKIYRSASGEPFPVCAKIVKTHLVDADSEHVVKVTVMIKMPTGYDPEHNDWWWGMYDAQGKTAEMSGKVQVCIACHQPAAEADYVFSRAVMAEANK